MVTLRTVPNKERLQYWKSFKGIVKLHPDCYRLKHYGFCWSFQVKIGEYWMNLASSIAVKNIQQIELIYGGSKVKDDKKKLADYLKQQNPEPEKRPYTLQERLFHRWSGLLNPRWRRRLY